MRLPEEAAARQRLSHLHGPNINTPLLANQATAKDLLSRAKPTYDATAKEIYDTYRGKTPT